MMGRNRLTPLTRGAWAWSWVAAAALAGVAAHANEADAKRLLNAMSDYMGAQQAISFDFDTSLEIVNTQQQKIALANSGTLTLNKKGEVSQGCEGQG